jgi:PhnB protein
MRVDPYLIFDGQCEAAFTFYKQCLGGTIAAMHRYADAPAGWDDQPGCEAVPSEFGNRIMHACLILDGQTLMASDTVPPFPHEGIKGCSVSLNVDSIAEAERIFAALSDGGTVQMPLGKTFWAARFGMCTDRFGVPWMINCEIDREDG